MNTSEQDMKDSINPIYQIKNVDIEAGDTELIKDVSISIFQEDRIGLIGSNGSGKSTFLKVLTEEISPKCTVEYVPQVTYINTNESILEFTSKKNSEWWGVFSFMEKFFDTRIDNLDQKVSSLSGGELTQLNICIALLNNPDVLLLDEPTNHLDLYSLAKLINVIKEYKGAVVVVSHDSFFLDQVTQKTWEISNKKLNIYQGNYTEVTKIKTNKLLQVEKEIIKAKKDYRKAITKREKNQQENAKINKIGKSLKGDQSMSTIEKGYFKNKATGSAGKKNALMTNEMLELNSQMKSLKSSREELNVKSPYVEIGSTETGRRRLIGIEDGVLCINNIVLIEGINLNIYFGDRIVLGGRNGSGKTALVKALLSEKGGFVLQGKKYLANAEIAYLSQRYERVQLEKSVYDNVKYSNSNINYEDSRKILANFLFTDIRDLDKKASILSGGELARLSLALATVNSVDLLILDEPTNNLDKESIDEFIRALSNYKGAVIAISHNLDFLDRVGIQESYVITKEKKFKKMLNIPHDKEEYLNELIKN